MRGRSRFAARGENRLPNKVSETKHRTDPKGGSLRRERGGVSPLQELEQERKRLQAELDGEGEGEGDGDGRPSAVDLIAGGEIDQVVNTPRGRGPRADGSYIRRAANTHKVPCLTTASAALAAVGGVADWARYGLSVRSLQEYYEGEQLRLDV